MEKLQNLIFFFSRRSVWKNYREKREGEMQKNLPTHQFISQNGHNDRARAAETRSLEFLPDHPHESKVSRTWSIFHCFLRPIRKELSEKRSSWDMKQIGCWHCSKWPNSLCHDTDLRITLPFKNYIYLFGKKREGRERERVSKKESTPTQRFTLQMPTVATNWD